MRSAAPALLPLVPAYYGSRIGTDRKVNSHTRRLEALRFPITLAPAA